MMMKYKVLLLLIFITSWVNGQNSGNITLDSFNKKMFSVEDKGYNSKPAEVLNLMEEAVFLGAEGKLDTATVMYVHSRNRELMFFALRQKVLTMEEVKNTFSGLDKSLESFKRCDKKQDHFKEIFYKDSTSLQTMKTVIDGLLACDCENADLYLKTAKRYYDKDTIPDNAIYVARYFLKKNGYGFALPLLQKAANSKDSKIASEANMEIAAAYRFYNRLEEAINHANKAIRLNPSNAMAYLVIGDCYYLGASVCGSTDLEKTGALWAAYDKYQKALKSDPSLKFIVKNRIAVINHRFPGTSDLVALKLAEGSPYKVNCWFKETTQVRARK